MKTLVNKFLLSFTAILIAVIAWLLGSNSGLKTLLDQVQNFVAVKIDYQRLDGSLWSDIQFEKLKVNWDGGSVDIDHGLLLANIFPLLTGKIDIRKLQTGDILLTLPSKKASSNQATPATAPPSEPSLALDNLNLPVRIAIKELGVQNLDLQQDKARQNLVKNLVIKNADFGQSLSFEAINFEREFLHVKSQGKVPFNRVDEVELTVNAEYDFSTRVKQVPLAVSISGVYPLIKVQSHAASPLNIDAETQLDFTDMNAITWHTQLAMHNFHLEKFLASNKTVVKKSDINLKGVLDKQDISAIKIEAVVDISKLGGGFEQDVNASLIAQLKNKQWHIDSLKITQPALQSLLTISGNIETDFTFDANTKMDLQLVAEKMQWPNNDVILSCQNGNMSVNGSIGHYQFHYTGDLTAAQHEITEMVFSGAGDLKQLSIDQFKASYLGGDWDGNGELHWSDKLNWKTELHATHANLTKLPYTATESLHSQLNGTLQHDGGFDENHHLYIHVSTPALKGNINRNQLTLGLDFLYQNDSLFFKNIRVRNRGTKLNGDLSFTALSADTLVESIWTLNAKDISGWYPGLHGQINSQGEIRGPLAAPIATISVRAKNVGNQSVSIGKLTGSLHHSISKTADSKLDIQVNDISIAQQKLDAFSINGSGTPASHQLEIQLDVDKNNQAKLNIDAAWKDKSWFATVSKTKIKKENSTGWLQPDASNLIVSAEESSLFHYCLSKVNAVDRVCIDSAVYSPHSSKVEANIANINLGLLLPRISTNIHNIGGNLSGNIDFTLNEKSQPNLITNLYISNGNIDLGSYNPKLPKLDFDRIIAKGTTQSGAFVGSAQASIPGQGELKADWNISSLKSLMEQNFNTPVEANLDISLYQLALIPEFIPDAQSTSGNWENHLHVSGPLEKLKITGISKLELDQLSIPRLGIKPKPTSVSLITDNSGTINFKASTQSGAGKITVDGSVPSYEDILEGLKLTLEGEKFQLFDLPEAKVMVSPKLKASTSKGVLNLQGSVLVPTAQIKIYDTGYGVTLSGDVKIVGQEQKTQTVPLDLVADVKLDLGDNIRIDTSGLKGKLTGSLTISERPKKPTTAVGELQIKDGTYRAYGSDLKIEEGRIIYTSSPLENPTLQIKAVSNNVTDIVVGIKITGSARNPVITLFSEPPMDQADVLSYIVLGYPVNKANNEEGAVLAKAATSIGFLGGEKLIRNLSEQFGLDEVNIKSSNASKDMSLVLGKYLSPKLYVQYAVGIGDTVNSVMLDYKWTNQISIKSESGQNQSTDIIYSIEKN